MRGELWSLLEACKREPGDVAARLVLADWLEEHGDDDDRERAAFLRLEATAGVGRHGRSPFDESWKPGNERPLPGWAPFLADLGKTAGAWSHGGMLRVSAAPKALASARARRWAGSDGWAWVERVEALPTSEASVVELMDSPLLETVAELAVDRAKLSDDAMAALARSPRLAMLRGLRLRNSKTRVGSLAAVARSPHAAGLRSLDLEDARLTSDDHAALADPAGLPGLEELTMPWDVRRGAGSAAVTAACVPRRLRSLTLNSWLLPADVRRLAASAALAGLRRLRLRPAEGIEAERLTGGTFWPGLESLTLDDHPLTAAEAAALARGPGTRLRSFSGQLADPAGSVAELAGSPLWADLTRLRLRANFDADRVAELTALPAAPRVLDLGGCGVGDAGAAVLAGWPAIARCRALNLSGNGLTEAGAAALAGSPYLGGLVGLDVAGNPLGDAGVGRLLRAGWLGGLGELSLSNVKGHLGARTALLAAAERMPRLKRLALDKHLLRDGLREAFGHVPYLEERGT